MSEEKLKYICNRCGRNASAEWWKCCPEHATVKGPDVLCEPCVRLELHPGETEFTPDWILEQRNQ